MKLLNEYLKYLNEGHGWRQRVEVFIKKDDKFILGYNPRHDIYMPAGGGVEDRETLEQAAERECLEELAIQTTNVQLISPKPFVIRYDEYGNVDMSDKLRSRMDKYVGQHVFFLSAEFVKVDKRLYGKDDDPLRPVVVDKQRAITLMKKNKYKITPYRIDALKQL